MKKVNYELISDEMFNYLNDGHKQNINKNAFDDISNVLLNFHYNANSSNSIRHVCSAPMGHGKSTVITSYLKWIAENQNDTAILLSVKEKHLANQIYNEVKKVTDSVLNITSDNKDLYELDLINYQIVIIQHERLKNLSLGYGNLYNYSTYKQRDKRIKRLLIVDERPLFVDSIMYDINSQNNVLDWFEDLSEPFVHNKPRTIQRYKTFISYLVGDHLAENNTDITNALIKPDEMETTRFKELLSFITELEFHPNNKSKYTSLNALRHFKNLLTVDGYGRIDDYFNGKIGRKIIVSKYIQYSNLKMNMLVFDGTANITYYMYSTDKFDLIETKNRNNYKRLTFNNDIINTSVSARSKKDKSVQEAISNRVKSFSKIDDEVFILPNKEDIKFYKDNGTISEKDYRSYYSDTSLTKGINILNTTGKNELADVKSLYMTNLPRKHADYYKEIAIALYDTELCLMTNDVQSTSSWFLDEKLENVYQYELYAEILQIIHRTALRKIDSDDEINIYIAYDDSRLQQDRNYKRIPQVLNELYCNGDAVDSPVFKLHNNKLYNRNETLDNFIEQIESKYEGVPLRVGEVSNSFSVYIRKNYNDTGKKLMIDDYFNSRGFKLIELKDRYSSKSRYIDKI